MSIDRKAWRFFHAHAGYVVGQRAIGAADLARAEEDAARQDWCFCWEWDEDSASEGCRSAITCNKPDSHEHEVFGCLVRTREGEVLASLWGIWDPDASYSRVIEAELASEALFTLRRQWGSTVHAR